MKEMITAAIDELFNDDTVQKLVNERIKKTVENVLKDFFGSFGKATKIIEKKLEEQMIPQIEEYNFAEHTIKLDAILTRVIKEINVDHKKIMNNFETFIIGEIPEEINLEGLLGIYSKYCAKEVNTSNLEVHECEEPSYSYLVCRVDVEEEKYPSKRIKLIFSCEQDENLKKKIKIFFASCDKQYFMSSNEIFDFAGLSKLDYFDINIIKLNNNFTNVNLEAKFVEFDDIEADQKPEFYCE